MSPSKRAFYEWWAEAHGGTPTKSEEACFQAGLEYALRVGTETNRNGSLVRGRVVSALRCLNAGELARENEALAKDLVWPCLELADGSVVYAEKKTPAGDYGPALLAGQAKPATAAPAKKKGKDKKATKPGERVHLWADRVRYLADQLGRQFGGEMLDGVLVQDEHPAVIGELRIAAGGGLLGR